MMVFMIVGPSMIIAKAAATVFGLKQPRLMPTKLADRPVFVNRERIGTYSNKRDYD